MLRAIAAALLLTAIVPAAWAGEKSLIEKKSAVSFDETVAQLEAALAARDIGVFSKIDHAAGAAGVGTTLRPTTLVIFGNPAIGSKLMIESQTIGIDLPLKALIYENEAGEVIFAHNDMSKIARRHGLSADHGVIARVSGALDAIGNAATAADGE